MNKGLSAGLVLVLVFLLSFGCATTKQFTSTVTSKMKSLGAGVDEEMYAQVPEEQREGISEAEFNLKVTAEKVSLFDLKKDLAARKTKVADYELAIANNLKKDAQTDLDIAKLKSIQRAGLGAPEKIAEEMGELNSKKLKFQADRVLLESKIKSTQLFIEQLTERMNAQEQSIMSMSTGAEIAE